MGKEEKLESPTSSFGSNFLKPHNHRKFLQRKEVEAKKMAENIKNILLDNSDEKQTQKTIRALQDPDLLGRVLKVLRDVPSDFNQNVIPINRNTKVHNKETRKIQRNLDPSRKANLAPRKNKTKALTPQKKTIQLAVNCTKRTRKINKQNKINPKIAQLASFFEKVTLESEIQFEQNLKQNKKPNSIFLSREIADELIKSNGSDDITLIDSGSSIIDNSKDKQIKIHTPEIEVTEVNSDTEDIYHCDSRISEASTKISPSIFTIGEPLNSKSISEPSIKTTLKESHLLKESYANKLRRRHAIKKQRNFPTLNESITVLNSPTFDHILPLDQKSSFMNPIKKYFGLSSSFKQGKNKKPANFQHHLQRAYLPLELIENIPVSEQVKVYINKEEVEAYRKSGMTYLDVNKIQENSLLNLYSDEKEAFPGLLSAAHDIWYEDLAPPKDGVSVYVYWWGYEVYIPDNVLTQLRKQGTTTTSIIGFIQAITVAVPLIQPILKILSTFISMESSASDLFRSNIGTVLTATWILPFLVIPRAWH